MSIKSILAEAINPVSMEENTDAVNIEALAFESMSVSDEQHEAAMDMLEAESAIEITQTAIVGMETLSDAVAACQENGGMDAQTSALLSAAVETVMAPFGGQSGTLPAQEAFEEDGGRVAATTVAQEGIMQTINDMWDAMVKMIKSAWDAVLKWFNSNFGRVERMKKAADALGKMAGEHTGKAKSDKIVVKNAYTLYTDDKFVGVDTSSFKDVTDALNGIADADIASVTALLKDGKIDTEENATALLKSMDELVAKNVGELTKQPEYKAKDSRFTNDAASVHLLSKVLPGNAFASAVVEEKKMPTAVFALPVKDKKAKDKEEASLEPKDIVAVASDVSKGADVLLKMKDSIKSTDDDLKSLEKLGEAIIKDIADDSGAKSKEAAKRVSSFTAKTNGNTRNMLKDGVSYATTFYMAAFAFAKASYKNLEAAK